ncbi:MAG: hypothetical protein K2V38_15645 [Gemmataceae bacterium]|nr:hypothetical protein [Gemmataceae bacterium]
MRSKLLLATFAALLGLAAGWWLRSPTSNSTVADPPALARPSVEVEQPAPGVAVAPRPHPYSPRAFIPLSEVYSTSFQRELAGPPPLAETYVRRFEELRQAATNPGTSNVFVVFADTREELVAYTFAALRYYYSPHVGTRRRAKPGTPLNLWLVAILRPTNSSPPGWEVTSVESFGYRVRLNYQRPKGVAGGTADVHPYVYWCKLPESHHLDYQLELYDEDEEVVALTRRVRVRPPITIDPTVVIE